MGGYINLKKTIQPNKEKVDKKSNHKMVRTPSRMDKMVQKKKEVRDKHTKNTHTETGTGKG